MKLVGVVAGLAALLIAFTAGAEAVSLDGTWQAEVAQDAQGEAMPAAFTRTIPVPGHWPLMTPSATCGKTEVLWCRTTWTAPAAIPPRALPYSALRSALEKGGVYLG